MTLLFGYKFWYRTKMFKPLEVDLYTGKDEIDRQEKEFLAEEAAKSKKAKKRGKFYKTFIGWLL